MNSKRHRAAMVAAWTTVAVIGVGSVGVAMAADRGSPSPALTASSTAGPADPAGGAAHKKVHSLQARSLHGEFVIQTKDGLRTVILQRGSVTAVASTSVTVKSSDGFTVTWTINDQTKVRDNRAPATAADLKPGVVVRIVGPRAGDSTIARLISIGTPGTPGTPAA